MSSGQISLAPSQTTRKSPAIEGALSTCTAGRRGFVSSGDSLSSFEEIGSNLRGTPDVSLPSGLLFCHWGKAILSVTVGALSKIWWFPRPITPCAFHLLVSQEKIGWMDLWEDKICEVVFTEHKFKWDKDLFAWLCESVFYYAYLCCCLLYTSDAADE